jgi:hypothetical protein
MIRAADAVVQDVVAAAERDIVRRSPLVTAALVSAGIAPRG